jgi:methionyl-tRNA formyltransferase
MKLAIFTSNSIRHKFLANNLAKNVDDTLVVIESREHDAAEIEQNSSPNPIDEHFKLRYDAEKDFFTGNDIFTSKTLPLVTKEINLLYTYEVIKKFDPDVMIVFGTSIIKKPLLSLGKPGKFLNLHLGLSPYYRGSGTNFWPFVNDELEYVGSTILHIDAGVDTGNIIAHVRPTFESGDTVHTIGCKVIKESVECLSKILNLIKEGKELNRTQQWVVDDEKYYKIKDFTEDVLLDYKNKLSNGLIDNYLKRPKKEIKLIKL